MPRYSQDLVEFHFARRQHALDVGHAEAAALTRSAAELFRNFRDRTRALIAFLLQDAERKVKAHTAGDLDSIAHVSADRTVRHRQRENRSSENQGCPQAATVARACQRCTHRYRRHDHRGNTHAYSSCGETLVLLRRRS